jgi:2-phosphosulfolactate phosphatase
MRRLDVLFRRQDLGACDAAGRACAVIDVLRAGTSVAYALAAGAKEIRLFREVDQAREARRKQRGATVLAGERGGLPPDGFDAGNSPRGFTKKLVSRKTVFFTTTNGTAALADCAGAAFASFAGLVNARAVARALASRDEDILLVASGTEGRCSVEDVLGAGMIGMFAKSGRAGESLELGDGALVAVDFAAHHLDDALALVTASEHGKRLAALGLGRDVADCAEVDSLDVVPVLRGDPLRLVRAAAT